MAKTVFNLRQVHPRQWEKEKRREGGERGDFVRHANLMSVLTVVSRFFGLIRDKVCAVYLGNKSTEWSAFWMGFQLPNLFRRIFGEGGANGDFRADLYAGTPPGWAGSGTTAGGTDGDVAGDVPGIADGSGGMRRGTDCHGFRGGRRENRLGGGDDCDHAPLLCAGLFCGVLLSAIASVHERFAAQSISPIILNLCMTLAAALPVWIWSVRLPLEKRIYWVAGSVLVAGVIQVGMMMVSLRRANAPVGFLMNFKDSSLGEVVSAMIPMMVGLSAVQLNTYMDTQIAWWLSPDGHNKAEQFALLGQVVKVPLQSGAVGILSVAQRLYLLPVGIFGVSMATAIFPQMARAVTKEDVPELKRRCWWRGCGRRCFSRCRRRLG